MLMWTLNDLFQRSLLLIVLLLLIAVPALSQTSTTDPNADDQNLLMKTLDLDIQTSTYYELLAWCQRLNLSNRGGREELQRRIYAHYGLTAKPRRSEEEDKPRELTIESAERTDYFELEETNEKYLQFLGNVSLIMEDKKNDSIHRIKADRILFNETANSLTAEGSLNYTLEQADKTEVFTGDSLTFSLDDWEGVFIKGTTAADREVGSQELTFYFYGRTIYRLTNDIIFLRNGSITSSDQESPYYRIDASTIWVLAPEEWALTNGLLYLGHVPMLYLPFFFHPGEELVFHPSLGVRDIEGYYFQTTTYLIGEAEKRKSTISFLQAADQSTASYRKELEGVFLRKRETEKEETAPGETNQPKSNNYLRIYIDLYTRLGFFGGIEGSFNDNKNLNDLFFSAGLARSRNLYQIANGGYTYLDRNEEGVYQSYWNDSDFLGMQLPVRFGLDLKISVKYPILALTGALRVFSDPFFIRDFYEREESIDWAKILGIEDETSGDTAGTSSSSAQKTNRLLWNVGFRFTPTVTELRPFIQSAQISRLNASMNWRLKNRPVEDFPSKYQVFSLDYMYPEREFFYPESYTFPAFTGLIAGTFLSTGSQSASRQGSSRQSPPTENDIELLPPWEPVEGESEEEKEEKEEDTLKIPSKQKDLPIPRPRIPSTFSHQLKYSISPDITIDSRTNSSLWLRPSDIDFATEYSILNSKTSASLQYSANVLDNFFQLSNNIAISGNYKSHFNLAEPEDPKWAQTPNQDKLASFLKLNNGISMTLSPLRQVQQLRNSSIKYSLATTIYQYKYETIENSYDHDLFSWDKDYINSHSMKMNVDFQTIIGKQQFIVDTVFPPLDQSLSLKVALNTGPFSHTLSAGFKKEDQWEPTLVKIGERITFLQGSYLEEIVNYDPKVSAFTDSKSELLIQLLNSNLSLRETFIYDLDDNKATSSATNLSFYWFSMQFQAKHTNDFVFVPGQGWVSDGQPPYNEEPRFLASQLNLSAKYKLPEQFFWRGRIKFASDINTSWNLNLLRVTNTSLSFALNLKLFIAEFLEFNFASQSLNKASYRYISGLSQKIGLNTLNPFVDIAKSFNFFNTQDRIESFFNLKSLSVSAIHHLRDWDLTVEYSGTPKPTNVDGFNTIEWSSELSIFVQWKPIPEFKREITTKDGEINF